VKPVAEADHAPVFVDDAALLVARPADPTAVVLQPACDLIEGRLRAAVYLIELRQRDIGDHIPVFAAIQREGKPAVVAVPQHIRVRGVNPQRMVIDMHGLCHLVGGAPAVDGGAQLRRQEVEAVRVAGAHAHIRIVEPARDDIGLAGDALEGLTAIGGTEQRAVVRLGNHIDDVRVAGGDLDADAPHQLRQSVGEFAPGASAVGGLEHAALLAAAGVRPRLALEPPHPCVQNVRVHGVNLKVGRTVLLVDIQHLLPSLAAVGGHKHPAFGVGTERRANRSDPHGVRVARVDDNAANLARLAQPQILPILAAVGGLVDATADGDAVARVRLACAHPNHIGVLRVECNISDRSRLLLVEQWRPSDTPVGGLPQPACARRDIDRSRIAWNTLDIGDTPAHVRGTDVARAQVLEQIRTDAC
jgi:hypothetical protein